MQPVKVGDLVGCCVSGEWEIIDVQEEGYRLRREAANGGWYFLTLPLLTRFRWQRRKVN